MSSTLTNTKILDTCGMSAALEHPDLHVPVLSATQRQGDVLVRKVDSKRGGGEPIPAKGVVVVRSEATASNTHTLFALEGDCFWAPNSRATDESELIQGWLTIPTNGSATLIHTEEHNVLGIGPGTYEIRRQREFAGEWRQVAD